MWSSIWRPCNVTFGQMTTTNSRIEIFQSKTARASVLSSIPYQTYETLIWDSNIKRKVFVIFCWKLLHHEKCLKVGGFLCVSLRPDVKLLSLWPNEKKNPNTFEHVLKEHTQGIVCDYVIKYGGENTLNSNTVRHEWALFF